MRTIILFLLSVCGTIAYGQNRLSLELAPHFDFLTTGLGTNDAGAGIDIRLTRAFKEKNDLAFETGWGSFWGSKVMDAGLLDGQLNNKTHFINSLLSYEYKPFPNLYLGIGGGVSVNRLNAQWYADPLIKPSIAVNVSRKNKGLVKLYYVVVPKPGESVRYAGVSFLARIL